jgi:hypothetical protein
VVEPLGEVRLQEQLDVSQASGPSLRVFDGRDFDLVCIVAVSALASLVASSSSRVNVFLGNVLTLSIVRMRTR